MIKYQVENLEQLDNPIGQWAADVIRAQQVEIERLRALHAEIVDELYGQGFDVRHWHLNGDTQPLDSWFEDNYWLDVETWDAEREAKQNRSEAAQAAERNQ